MVSKIFLGAKLLLAVVVFCIVVAVVAFRSLISRR
jgi:hypothetical protein